MEHTGHTSGIQGQGRRLVHLLGTHVPYLATICLLAMACRTSAATQDPNVHGGTPQELVDAIRAVERSGRYGEALRHILPSEREEAVYIVWFAAAYDAIGDDSERREAYAAIVSRHDLDEQWLSQDVSGGREKLRQVAADALRGKSLEALFGDLTAFRVEHGLFGYAFGFLEGPPQLSVAKERASALIGTSEFTFTKHEGRWYWRFLPREDD